MGTDIHAFIEIDLDQSSEPFCKDTAIICFNRAPFSLERNYDLFDALAGARSSRSKNLTDNKKPLFGIRGIPKYISDEVFRSFYFIVTDDEDATFGNCHYWGQMPFLTETTKSAERLIDERGISYLSLENCPDRYRDSKFLVGRDWHHAGWLYRSEYEESLEHYGIDSDSLQTEYRILLHIMREYEKDRGKNCVRLVFWFDN